MDVFIRNDNKAETLFFDVKFHPLDSNLNGQRNLFDVSLPVEPHLLWKSLPLGSLEVTLRLFGIVVDVPSDQIWK